MEVETVVCNWLHTAVEYDTVIHEGLGHVVGRSIVLFYADDGLIG